VRLYLAGPMTSVPQFNFPLFTYWAQRLRNAGFEVLSPHESDDHDVQKAAWASETGATSDLPPSKEGSDPVLTLKKNVDDICQCQGIALLENWNRSPGVIHEIATATRLKLPVAPVEMWYFCGPLVEKHLP
jgi:hypothetical protein